MVRLLIVLLVAGSSWAEDWVNIHYADGDVARSFLYNKERKLLFSPSVFRGKNAITIRRADKPDGSTIEVARPASVKGTLNFPPVVDSMKKAEPGAKHGVCSLVLQEAAAGGDMRYAAAWLSLPDGATKADVDAVISEMGAALDRHHGHRGAWLAGQ